MPACASKGRRRASWSLQAPAALSGLALYLVIIDYRHLFPLVLQKIARFVKISFCVTKYILLLDVLYALLRSSHPISPEVS